MCFGITVFVKSESKRIIYIGTIREKLSNKLITFVISKVVLQFLNKFISEN